MGQSPLHFVEVSLFVDAAAIAIVIVIVAGHQLAGWSFVRQTYLFYYGWECDRTRRTMSFDSSKELKNKEWDCSLTNLHKLQ